MPPRVARLLGAGVVTVVAVASVAVVTRHAVGDDTPATFASDPAGDDARAAAVVAALVASRPAALHAGPDDGFVPRPVISSLGWRYVPYERTYRGLPVIGGDFVVVVDPAGRVSSTSVAQRYTVKGIGTTPGVTLAAAQTAAAGRLRSVSKVEGGRLVVYGLGATPRLAWESTVEGVGADGRSRLSVHVDALTGAVLDSREHVMPDQGYGAHNGPNPLFIRSTESDIDPGIHLLKDPVTRRLSCADATTRTVFDSVDTVWGSGKFASKETQCVDAMFAARTQVKLVTHWLGRNGPDGAGGAWPIFVGLNADDAFFTGNSIEFGYDSTHNRPFTSLDIVGHEMGHGIDATTPGGLSRKGTAEFIADVFGVATEWYANEPAPHDTPDYTLGEQQKLTYAVRYMDSPAQGLGDECYYGNLENAGHSAHAAAGVGDRWFYLLAEGSNPTNGQPASGTCNFTTLTGIGLVKALQVLYHAMLMKTSDSSYRAYRRWTLTAANNLFPGDCTAYNTVRAAWGLIEVFATTTAGEVLRRREAAAYQWTPWTYLTDRHWETGRANRFTSIAMARNNDGRLDLYGLNAGQVQLRYETVPGGSWSDWTPFGDTPPGLVDLDAEANADGRITLFGVDGAGTVYVRTQGSPIWNWSPWTAFGPIGVNSVVVPDVRGSTTVAAVQAVQAGGGLVADVSYFVDLSCNNIGTVKSQSPAGGTVATLATVVRLSVGTSPPPGYACN